MGTGPLLIVQNDATFFPVKRIGRFTLPEDCAASAPHLRMAVGQMQEKMIADLAKRGYVWVERYGFDLEGPFEHLIVSDNTSPDPGPLGGPDPLDLRAQEAWERAEKARVAHTIGEAVHLVDYTLKAVFKHRQPVTFRRF